MRVGIGQHLGDEGALLVEVALLFPEEGDARIVHPAVEAFEVGVGIERAQAERLAQPGDMAAVDGAGRPRRAQRVALAVADAVRQRIAVACLARQPEFGLLNESVARAAHATPIERLGEPALQQRRHGCREVGQVDLECGKHGVGAEQCRQRGGEHGTRLDAGVKHGDRRAALLAASGAEQQAKLRSARARHGQFMLGERDFEE